MARRVRQVHSTTMVAHLFAHKAQDSARNGSGNFYFKGDVVYSYGNHFPIARHVETKHGQAAGKRWGGGKPGRRVRLSIEKEQAIRQLHAQGRSVSEISRIVGLSRPTVYKVLG